MQQAFRNRTMAGTVYVEGKSLIGDHQEFTLPNIQMMVQDVRNGGMLGPAAQFTGMERPQATIVSDAYLADVLTQVGSPNIRAKNYSARWSTQSADGEVKYGVAEFSGRASNVERGALSNGEDGMATTITIECVSYKETFDGKLIYDINLETGKLIVDGEDHWKPIKDGL